MEECLLCLLILGFLYAQGYAQCVPQTQISNSDIRVGESVTIRCSVEYDATCRNEISTMEYHKRASKDYNWTPEFRMFPGGSGEDIPSEYDYIIHDRVTVDVLEGDYDLIINTAELADGGDWRCVYKGGDTYESSVIELNVTDTCDINLMGPPSDDFFLLGVPHQYTCTCSQLLPKITPIWLMGNDEQAGGRTVFSMKNYVWSMESVIDIISASRDESNVTCFMQKPEDNKWETSDSVIPDEDKIMVVPTIGDGTTGGPINSTTSATLHLRCVACGSRVDVEWLQNDKILTFPNGLFDIHTNSTQADCPFGEPTAIVSTLTWKPPPSSSSALCKDKTKHNGQYFCKVNGLLGHEHISPEMTVKFQHTNACISDGGLAGIIVGTIVGVCICIAGVYFIFFYQKQDN